MDKHEEVTQFLGYAEDSIRYIMRNISTGRIFHGRTFFCDEIEHSKQLRESRLLAANGECIDPSAISIEFDLRVEEDDEFRHELYHFDGDEAQEEIIKEEETEEL